MFLSFQTGMLKIANSIDREISSSVSLEISVNDTKAEVGIQYVSSKI